jgi:tetratricopeptide (TPR) repeat protein
MISIKRKHLRAGLALLAGGTAAMPAAAQVQPYGQQQLAPYKEDAGTALNRHLRTLADQPRNLQALTGAGKAALQLGDPQAALTFFARAEEIAPRDGRVKAGMGSAFLAMEQPIPAMKFFDEAMALGVPEAEFSGDRGLAFDLAGNPRRAQADYSMALRRGEDPEVRRRLALSLAISGDRNQALATIDDQLRRQDRAAWRTRAFILALSGDVAEATRTTESVMPGMASQLSPFYAKLAGLNPAQRAAAVHFGHMPSGASAGTQYAGIPQYPPAAPPAVRQSAPQPTPVTSAPQPAPPAQRQQRTQPPRDRYDPFDRYGMRSSRSTRSAEQQARETAAPQRQTPPAPVQQQLPVAVQTQPPLRQAQPVQVQPQPQPQPVQVQPQPAQAQAQRPVSGPPADLPADLPRQQPVAQAPAVVAQQAPVVAPTIAPGFSVQANPIQQASPAPAAIVPVEIAASTVSQARSDTPAAAAPAPAEEAPAEHAAQPEPGFADIAAAIAKLPSESPPQPIVPAEPAPTTFAQLGVKPAPKPAAPRAEPKKSVAETKKEEPKQDSSKKQEFAKKEESSKKEESEKKEPAKKEPAKKEALTKKEEAAKKAEEAKKAEPAKPKEPSRIWVQVAGGADKNALPREYARLKDKAPKLLAGQSAWTTPLRATNRLLVGPFKSEKEAQDLVNELNKAGFSAFTWTSPAGQEIEKLGK